MKRETRWLGAAWKMGAGGIAALLLVGILVFLPVQAKADAGGGAQISVGISVSFGPPPLPVYQQPMCPGPGFIWTPGYWAWSAGYGYYWVPGTWVRPPFRGALWTPGYWGWDPVRLVFLWHSGYWGPRVGFYGGIDYGFGYPGRGYDGGYWDHDRFYYNRAVNRLNLRYMRHYYYRDEHHHWDNRRISFNGGRGGLDVRPTRRDFEARRDRRMGPMSEQFRQRRMAGQRRDLRWSVNHGRPGIAATDRPGRFMGPHAVRATRAGGPYHPERVRGRDAHQNGQWHVFGGRNGGRQQPRQQDHRVMGRQQRMGGQHGFSQRNYQGRGDAGRQRMQRFPQQRQNRGRQDRNFSRQSNGNRQQMRGRQGQRGGAERGRGGRSNDHGRGGRQHGGQSHDGNHHGRGHGHR